MKVTVAQIARSFRATTDAMRAFFKAYDDVAFTTSLGFPRLRAWSEGDAPLEQYLSRSRSHEDQVMTAGLLFVEGKDRGEAVYLGQGIHTLGTSSQCTITIATRKSSERRLEIEVQESGVYARAPWNDAPLTVNGTIIQEARLVDQDECRFEGSLFYFVDLTT